MIGNDIIDLSLAQSESNWQRKGFLEKQFTENEHQLVLTASNPLVLVWRLWSMKEAAYKAYVQKNELRFYAPQKFDCQLTSEKDGLVYFKNKIFYTSSIITRDYIFTLASITKTTKAYSELVRPELIDSMIKIKLEDVTKYSALKIEQKKTKNRAPSYYYKNILLTKSCSISHHGKYAVFSLLHK